MGSDQQYAIIAGNYFDIIFIQWGLRSDHFPSNNEMSFIRIQ